MKLSRPVIPTLLAIAFLGGWEWFVCVGHVNEVLVPAPSHIFKWFYESLTNGELLSATWVTMRRLMIGFAIGAALGVPLGALCARVRWVRDTLGVLALGLQTLPSVCWVPLALLWFGQEESAVLFVVVMAPFGRSSLPFKNRCSPSNRFI